MNSEDLINHQVKHISVMGSTAHTYGNLLATAQKWVLDALSAIKFKTIHVSSVIAHKQILSTPHQFLKKERPIIVFRPRISYTEEVFLKDTLLTQRMGGPTTTNTTGIIELHPFFFDDKAQISGQFTQSRRVMFLDVAMTFSTYIQQLNYMDYFYNQLQLDRPFDINTHLEAFLPKEVMELIGEIAGVPVHNTDGSVHDFLTYMNDHSYYPITYKLAGSTGKEEFYRYYPTKILATITDLDRGDGENLNQVMSNYQVTFTMKLEFWTPGTTYIFSDHVHPIPTASIPADSTLIPIYADVFMLEDLDLAPGWSVFSHASFVLEKPYDSISFEPMLPESIRAVIAYHLKNGIPMLNFLDIKVRKQGELISLGDYVVDYEKLEVRFANKSFGFYTYTLILSVDIGYINQMVKDIFHLK